MRHSNRCRYRFACIILSENKNCINFKLFYTSWAVFKLPLIDSHQQLPWLMASTKFWIKVNAARTKFTVVNGKWNDRPNLHFDDVTFSVRQTCIDADIDWLKPVVQFSCCEEFAHVIENAIRACICILDALCRYVLAYALCRSYLFDI